MVADRREITSLQKPPEGYFWSPEARALRHQSRTTERVFNVRPSKSGPRPDAVETKYLPTLTPGVDKLPQRCIFCRSALLDKHEAAGREQRGTLTCTACGRQLAWLRARITAGSRPSLSPVTDSSRPARTEPIVHSMAPAEVREAWRRPSCGDLCGRERVMRFGSRKGFEWREYHDPDAHDEHAAALTIALAVAVSRRPAADAVVRTGPLVIDLAGKRCLLGGQEVSLTQVETEILHHLARHVGAVCALGEIMAAVWPGDVKHDGSGKLSLRCPEHALRINMVRLRGKLGASRWLIETRPRYGYVLRAEPPTGGEP